MSGRGFFRPRLLPPPRGRQASGDAPGAAAGIDRFRAVMLPHMDAAYGFARYLTRDGAAAEDVVQEAYLRALRGFEGWRGGNSRAWLLAIVRNCYVDMISARRDPLRGAEPLEAVDDATALADTTRLEEQVALSSDAAKVRCSIENISEPFREALVLRELEELSYSEIAAITQVPIGTVMSRLARGRAMLAAVLLPPGEQACEARS